MTPREVIVGCFAKDSHREARADAILAALRAAGLAVVPREPTPAMIHAAPARDGQATEPTMYHGIWRAMLAAAEGDKR